MTKRCIIFDLGNVLIHIRPEKTIGQLARCCGAADEDVKAFFLSPAHLQLMSGEIDIRQFHQAFEKSYICELFFPNFVKIWEDIIGDSKTGMDALVSRLSSKFTLVVCSNTDPLHWGKALSGSPFISRYFQHFFLSYEMGLLKPDKILFEQMLNSLQVQPEECVFIDDTAENVQSARECGMVAFCSSDATQVKAQLQAIRLID